MWCSYNGAHRGIPIHPCCSTLLSLDLDQLVLAQSLDPYFNSSDISCLLQLNQLCLGEQSQEATNQSERNNDQPPKAITEPQGYVVVDHSDAKLWWHFPRAAGCVLVARSVRTRS